MENKFENLSSKELFETYKKIEEFMKILEKEEKNTEKMRNDK